MRRGACVCLAFLILLGLSGCAKPKSKIVPLVCPDQALLASQPAQTEEAASSAEPEKTPEPGMPIVEPDVLFATEKLDPSFFCDFIGNPLKADFFAENGITMINVWTTWCGYCIQEMPQLQEISEQYSGRVTVTGLLRDGVDGWFSPEQDMIEGAKEILSSRGVEYDSILPTQAAEELMQEIAFYPMTFFVDREGNLIGGGYIGIRTSEEWDEIINGILKAAEK